MLLFFQCLHVVSVFNFPFTEIQHHNTTLLRPCSASVLLRCFSLPTWLRLLLLSVAYIAVLSMNRHKQTHLDTNKHTETQTTNTQLHKQTYLDTNQRTNTGSPQQKQTHKHRYRPTNTDTQALTDPQTQVHKQTGCKQLKNTGEPKLTNNAAAAAFIAVENTDEHKTNAEKKCKPRRQHHTT